MENREGIESVRKTLKLLALMAQQGGSLTVTQIADMLDCSVSSANRFLQTLLLENFARKNPETNRYELTYRMYALGASNVAHDPSMEKLIPIAHAVSQKYDVSVNINGVEGENAILLFRVTRFHNKDLDFFSGEMAPVYCTSSGKAILSLMEPEELEPILEKLQFRAFQNESVSIEQLREELRIARQNGYAVCQEEYVSGVFSFSLPVRDRRGHSYAFTLIMPMKDRNRVFRREVIQELQSRLSCIRDTVI
ncbi:MAG: helix-turn-helix domain-containing protein [Oscillospiraceae bacterium]|nr:helix-turn-helix domain-containing protein [Oscillospiraceae bacterium]